MVFSCMVLVFLWLLGLACGHARGWGFCSLLWKLCALGLVSGFVVLLLLGFLLDSLGKGVEVMIYIVDLAGVLLAFSTGTLIGAASTELKRKPLHPGYCARCRYNLTGNTSGVCPECGTAIRS